MLDSSGSSPPRTAARSDSRGTRGKESSARTFGLSMPRSTPTAHPQPLLETAVREGRSGEERARTGRGRLRFSATFIITAIRDQWGGLDRVCEGHPRSRRSAASRKGNARRRREAERICARARRRFGCWSTTCATTRCSCSTPGLVLTWNKGAERIKGCTADEIIGQSFVRFSVVPTDIDHRAYPT